MKKRSRCVVLVDFNVILVDLVVVVVGNGGVLVVIIVLYMLIIDFNVNNVG